MTHILAFKRLMTVGIKEFLRLEPYKLMGAFVYNVSLSVSLSFM